MHSPEGDVASGIRVFDAHIAGVDAYVEAPPEILADVASMLAQVARASSGSEAAVRIVATASGDLWHIGGSSSKSRKILRVGTPPTRVAGAVISALLTEIAVVGNYDLWRTAAVERNGQALVMFGDDWESCVTLVTHFHTRGWWIIGGDYLLVSKDGATAYGVRKSLHLNSSCLAALPEWYRAATEASPWYSTSEAIAFYAVDPTLVRGARPWSDGAPIRALLRVDGHAAAKPSLEPVTEFTVAEGVVTNRLVDAGIEVAMLVLGNFVETATFVESWFDGLARPA
jgi:hypothetical protein